jgi:uncharacterized Zn-binding protein involved in type VI secretion
MSRQIVRVGDVNSGGGRVISGDPSVRINKLDVAVEGSPVTPHPRPKGAIQHDIAQCRATESRIKVKGKRIILVNDIDTCGHARIQGSPNVGG